MQKTFTSQRGTAIPSTSTFYRVTAAGIENRPEHRAAMFTGQCSWGLAHVTRRAESCARGQPECRGETSQIKADSARRR